MANVGFSKVFLLDKYFSELHKFNVKIAADLGQGPEPDPSYANQPSQPPGVDDLALLQGPLTEDLLLKSLQRRIAMGKHHVWLGPVLLLFAPNVTQPNPDLSPLLNLASTILQCSSGLPQTIVLSGFSGSGKTHNAKMLLKELMQDSDQFRQVSASLTVVQAMGSVKSTWNGQSSRVGHYIDVQLTERSPSRARLHCYFLNQTLTSRPATDSNYLVFYQLLHGLTEDEKNGLFLQSVESLKYLQGVRVERMGGFEEWRAALSLLGIPFGEVVRVLAAVLLLGNLEFGVAQPNQILLQQISTLLGISASSLLTGLTTRTINSVVKTKTNTEAHRNALAKSLYVRTFATIVRRANSVKKSDGSESADSRATIGSRRGLTALNAAVRSVTDSSIGVLDMFGFEDGQPSQLEQLCLNLCAETMQHFYNTHIFKASLDACADEGIQPTNFEYLDNVPLIDLISSLRTGLLSLLDSSEDYLKAVQTQHGSNPKLTITQSGFIIEHFAGKVEYDTTSFQDTNRDLLPDDVVAVFHKHHCSFGFASHLFTSELKILSAGGLQPIPKGFCFRISPSSSELPLASALPSTTLTQDFHSRLDALLRTLVHSKPHFVRCLRGSDRASLTRQLRCFQLVESLNLFVHGFPVRIRLKAFSSRYGDCKAVLEKVKDGWAIGRRHVFLSSSAHKQLESELRQRQSAAATLIQARWRGWAIRRKRLKAHKVLVSTASIVSCRPQPISSTPPPGELVERTCQLFGLDLEKAPPLPSCRHYTVHKATKFGYPQLRVMRLPFPDASPILQKKELVTVTGISNLRGHLLVEAKGRSAFHVPYSYLEFGLKTGVD